MRFLVLHLHDLRPGRVRDVSICRRARHFGDGPRRAGDAQRGQRAHDRCQGTHARRADRTNGVGRRHQGSDRPAVARSDRTAQRSLVARAVAPVVAGREQHAPDRTPYGFVPEATDQIGKLARGDRVGRRSEGAARRLDAARSRPYRSACAGGDAPEQASTSGTANQGV